MQRIRLRHGFTLTDLSCSLALVVLLSAVALGGPFSRAREASERIKCASNLRQLGLAMLMYSNSERNGGFPRVRYTADDPKPTSFTHPDANAPFSVTGPDANDVTAALFLLLRTQDILPKVFICPSTAASAIQFSKGKSAVDFSNFKSTATLSYSMSNPYPSKDAMGDGFHWNNTLPSDFALAADLNPGGAALVHLKIDSPKEKLQEGNSPNHGSEGQNVLFGDCHVEFQNTPFCGVPSGGPPKWIRDNIYTYGAATNDGTGGVVGAPTFGKDNVMLPVADATGKAATRPTTQPE